MNITIIDESLNFDEFYSNLEKEFQNKNFLTKIKRFYSLKVASQEIFKNFEGKEFINIDSSFINLVLMDICYPKFREKKFLNWFEFYLKLKENLPNVKCVLLKYNLPISSKIIIEILKNGDLLLQKNKVSIEDFTKQITDIFCSPRKGGINKF